MKLWTREKVKKYDFHARFNNECRANFPHIFLEFKKSDFSSKQTIEISNGIPFIRYKKKKNDVVKNGRNCAIEFIYGKTFFLLYSIFNAFLSERCIRFMVRMKITRFNIGTVYLFNKFYGKLLLLCIKLVKNDIFLIWNTHKRIDKLINIATSKPSILFH